MILGQISAYSAGTGVTLTIDGETSPTTKEYCFLESYSPTVGDRVLIEEISGTYVVIGKITKTAGGSNIADRMTKYDGTAGYIEFTYFNSNLWARIDGGTQFALKKG